MKKPRIWRWDCDLGVGPGTPDGRPMAANLPTGEGDVLAAVITAGKPFLLMAKLHNGSAAPMDLKQFTLDVPEGWKSELFMDKCRNDSRRAMVAR